LSLAGQSHRLAFRKKTRGGETHTIQKLRAAAPARGSTEALLGGHMCLPSASRTTHDARRSVHIAEPRVAAGVARLGFAAARLAGWVFAAICGGPARLGFAVVVLGKKK